MNRTIKKMTEIRGVEGRPGYYRVTPGLLKSLDERRSPSRDRTVSAGRAATDEARSIFRRSLRWANHHLRLPGHVVEILIAGAELRSYDAEEVIDIDGALHATVLVSGSARVMVDVGPGSDVGVWIAKPGHFIGAGWVGRRGSEAQAFYAIAHQECHVAILRPELMENVIGALSANQLIDFIAYCNEALSRQLYNKAVMLPMTKPERLLYQLQVLANDFPKRCSEGTIIDLSLGRRQLAPLIASGEPQLTKALADLKAAGRVRLLENERILVVGYFAPLASLAATAGGRES